ncbi:MAG TPA: histidine phosphatase family protein [Anaeromyxobacteraceae bacterium]|nr:histidine phosphatase family protein [Anaeromyxobacteraceae bacterium]
MTAPAGRFYLVRHAKAERQGAAPDDARRLTDEGRLAFGARLRALAPRLAVRRVVTSPFARARETAELLALATGAAVEEEEALASGASTGRQLLALGRALGAGCALVGHNPELAEAIALAGGGDVEVPPGTVAAIEADGTLAWVE